MTVVPYRTPLFPQQAELYQSLLNAQRAAIAQHQSQILSLSLEIDSVDPLAVLQALHQPQHLHFYFEKNGSFADLATPVPAVAIAAIGAAAAHEVSGLQRFDSTQTFVEECLRHTHTLGDPDLPFSGPHFFCSFTFFDEPAQEPAPFPAATVFLPRWQITRWRDRCLLVVNRVVRADSDLNELLRDIQDGFETLTSVRYTAPDLPFRHTEILQQQHFIDPSTYKQGVTAALQSIHQRAFHKVVLAHALDVRSPLPFHLITALSNLRRLYPDCYIFSTSNRQGQNFLGASPERLLSIRNHQLMTDALAGSAPRGRNGVEDETLAQGLLMSDKERHEHTVVIDFILQRLKRLGCLPRHAPIPHLLRLSNIQHLRTVIQAEVPTELHPLEVLAELHPTPAVAGAPREIACAHIRRYETFERSLYAGPLGWLNHRGDAEFIVGIRSALIDNCQARLYAGAGIVAGSNPEQELAEVQLKLQALLAVLL